MWASRQGSRRDPHHPAGIAPPMFGEADRSLNAGRGDDQRIAVAHATGRLEQPFEHTAGPGAIFGGHAVPGPTIRAVNSDLNGRALRRAGLPEFDQLESQLGDVAADSL